LAIGLAITINVRNVHAVGDIALVIPDWSLKGTGADGSKVDMSGSTAEVARRGPDDWKFIGRQPLRHRPVKRVGCTAYCAGKKLAA
jgi:ketosteroid isomerase-like protein